MYDDKLPDMSAAYAEIQEKMAKKDHDGDGKIETGKEEYFGARDKAIKKAMKKEHHEKDADGKVIEHDDEELQEIAPAIAAIPAVLAKGAAVVGKGAMAAGKVAGKVASSGVKAAGQGAKAVGKAAGEGIKQGVKAGAATAGETVATAAGEIAANKLKQKAGMVAASYESEGDSITEDPDTVSDKAYDRAKTLARARHNRKDRGGVGKNERAGYNLSQSQKSRNRSPETQGGSQTGGGAKSFGFARNKSNPVKSKSMGDSGAIGHRKKRDEKVTTKKDGKTPLKTPRYKLSMGKRVDHHSSRRQELKDPKKNPKHTANK